MPFTPGVVVNRFQDSTNPLMLECAKPSRPCTWIGIEPHSDRLDDEDVGEARCYRFSAGLGLGEFPRHEAQGISTGGCRR